MRILAVDYGEVRTGIAISDCTQTIASPLTVITEKGAKALAAKIAAIAEENEVCAVVIGNPLNMDGSDSEKTGRCKKLANRLRNLQKSPVVMQDERLTTVEAHSILDGNYCTGNKRDKKIDAVAAAVILEEYLATL